MHQLHYSINDFKQFKEANEELEYERALSSFYKLLVYNKVIKARKILDPNMAKKYHVGMKTTIILMSNQYINYSNVEEKIIALVGKETSNMIFMDAFNGSFFSGQINTTKQNACTHNDDDDDFELPYSFHTPMPGKVKRK